MKRKCLVFLLVMCVSGIMFSKAAAQDERATAEECVAMVEKVVKRIETGGFEAVKSEVGKPGGAYSWKDGYVFCMDAEEGYMTAHPYLPPQLMAKPLLGMTDVNGKAYIREMRDTANRDGKGWVDFMAQKRGVMGSILKRTYVVKIPDAEIIVGAGYYPTDE